MDLWLSPQGRTFARAARAATWRSRRYLGPHIVDVLGARQLNKLTAADIFNAQHVLRQQGMRASSINTTTHGVLFAMLRDYEAVGKVRPQVRARVKFAPQLQAEPSEKLFYFTAEQRDRAIAAFPDWPVVPFLFLTAVRRGEAAGLRRSDIDWQLRSVAISRTLSDSGVVTPCKTRRSQRTIHLGDQAFDCILPLKHGEPDALLFLSARGQPMDFDTFALRVWYPRLKAAGLPRLTLHGTRHTWATNALVLGIDIEDVAAQLGDTPETVRDVYDHVIRRFDPNAAVRPPPTPPTTLQVVAERRAQCSYLRLVK